MIAQVLRFVVEDVDRHGNVRVYLRRKGLKKIRLHAMPGTPAFMEEYRLAMALFEPASQRRRAPSFAETGSFRRLCQAYFSSPEYLGLDVSTREWRRRALELICEKHGVKPFARMDAKAVRMLRDELATKPGAANSRLKALKALFSWAVEAHEANNNPARDVRLLRYATKGHHSWSHEEIAQFEDRHPIGSKPRLAMALLLYTACRREDAPRLGPQHVKAGRIRFTQAKNEHRKPVLIDMPVAAPLQAVLDSTPIRHLTFLVTEYGKPFTAAGFGNRFREWCDQAGLTGCSAHGLRKAMAAMLAESDATAHQIGAVTGHSSLEEIERYTRAASKSRLADEAIGKLGKGRM